MIAAFDPFSALVGGALIGLATTLLLWLNGRVAGVSGILAGAIGAPGPERDWRTAFLVGLIFGPIVFAFLGGTLPTPVLPEMPVIVGAGHDAHPHRAAHHERQRRVPCAGHFEKAQDLGRIGHAGQQQPEPEDQAGEEGRDGAHP